MNKKVFTSMLSLCVIFLVGLYIAKIFYPQEFIMVISNEQLIKIGDFIDKNTLLMYICSGITSFIVYWLYCCACSKRLYLKWYECLYILATIVLCRVFYTIDFNLYNAISVSSFIFLPALMKGDLKICAIVYPIHCLAQTLSLSIRNLPIYLTHINSIISILMVAECYLWLVLFYIIFNYKKKES